MKYMGSKARIAKYILPIILANKTKMDWYIEPFVGGANIIDKVDGMQRWGNDNNKYLIALLNAIKRHWIPPEISRDEYRHIRDNKDKYDDALVGWVGFMCSYSGKWFGGYAGKTKTKTGIVRDYQAEALRNIQKQAENLTWVTFSCMDYSSMVFPSNSIVYCDPPYKKTTTYHSKFNHDIFWDWVRTQVIRGCDVFVSEYEAPDDFVCVWKGAVKSSLSANGKIGGNKNSVEKLFIKQQL